MELVLKAQALAATAALAGMAGCGTSVNPGNIAATGASQPIAQACTTAITGRMEDSLTFSPVARGLVLLESGTPQPQLLAGVDTKTTEFLEAARAASAADGTFRLCVPDPISAPTIVVFVAEDGKGKHYPPFVMGATVAADLGPVTMGGCDVSCDLTQGTQSAAPTVLEGAVTTSPATKAGLVAAQIGIAPLDGSQAVWAVSIPGLGEAETNAFQTSAGTCAGPCSPYRFTLPSLAPIVQTDRQFVLSGSGPGTGQGKRTQQRGAVLYTVYATASGCKYPFAEAAVASDGHTFLAASSGAVLDAADAAFTDCR